MYVNIEDNMVRVIILDISGVYVQIYDQGFFEYTLIEQIKQQYSDPKQWLVLVLDE